MGKVRLILKVMFRKREILIRSNGVVHFIPMGGRAQALLYGLLGLIVIAVLSLFIMLHGKNQKIAQQQRQIAATEIVMADLTAHQLRYRDQLENIAKIVARPDQNDSQAAKLSTDWLARLREKDEKAPPFFIDSFQFLHTAILAELQDIENHIKAGFAKKDALETTNGMLLSRLESLEKSHGLTNNINQNLTLKIAALKNQQLNLRQEISRLHGLNVQINTKLADTHKNLQLSQQNQKQYHALLSATQTLLHSLEQDVKRIEISHDIQSKKLASKKQIQNILAQLRLNPSNSEAIAEIDIVAYVEKLHKETTLVKANYHRILQHSKQQEKSLDLLANQILRFTAPEDALSKHDLPSATPQKELLAKSENTLDLVQDWRVKKAITQTTHLAEIYANHKQQYDKLIVLADANIAANEAIIEKTGINFLQFFANRNAFWALGGMGGGNQLQYDLGPVFDMQSARENLDKRISHLDYLNSLLACMPLISPVDYFHLTSKFGKRRDPFTGKPQMHKGVDLAGWPGTKVYATASGVVTFAGRKGKYGKIVEVTHECGIVTKYAHMKKIQVKKGQKVAHRAFLGTLGSTGRSTGPHVHYEIVVDGKSVDPMKFIEAGRYVFKENNKI